MINSLGITFSVWEKSNADGKGSGTYDWTSLIDSDKKKLLHLLPTQLESRDILFPETKETVIKIWRDFEGKWKPAPWCLAKIKGICQTLLLPWRKQSWVQQSTCNPYMHSHTMCQYSIIRDDNSFKQFTGQGVEKNDAKRIFFQKSNKWDAARDVLHLEARQQALGHFMCASLFFF